MIAYYRKSSGPELVPGEAFAETLASSLGLFGGGPASYVRLGNSYFLKDEKSAGRAARRPRKLALHRGASGAHVLVHGNIDNRRSLAGDLGLSADDPEQLYLAAFERWGDACDLHVVGDYCALIELPDGQGTRLARSPWRGCPLVFSHDASRTIVASVPRVLLAAGLPAVLDEARMAASLSLNHNAGLFWYKGIFALEVGELAWLRPDGSQEVRGYYDHLAFRRTRLRRREDYVEAAESLLNEAVAATLDGSVNPGAYLSGGLDSANVVSRAVRHLPTGKKLKTFTFRPHEDFKEPTGGPYFGDDWQFVREYLREYPQIEGHWARTGSYDRGWERMFLAIGCAPCGLQNMMLFDPILKMASQQGCDLILGSDFGNQTLSNDARWAYSEYFFKGRWLQLHRAISAHRPRPRPMPLAYLWHGLGPALPHRLWSWYQRVNGREGRPFQRQVSCLSEEAVRRHDPWRRFNQRNPLIYRSWHSSKRRWLADELGRGTEGVGEIEQGFEQVYNLRIRDAMTYRPLVEFALGLPTDLFMHNGTTRWLSRELGRGRIPEEQRTCNRLGMHNCDWHERITPQLGEWSATMQAAKDDPLLAKLLDFARIERLIDEWPAEGSVERGPLVRFALALPRAVSAARFVRFATGANR